jgi:hypothetical protein
MGSTGPKKEGAVVWVFVLLAVVAVSAVGLLVVSTGDQRQINERLHRYAAPQDRVLTRLRRYAG